MGIAAAFFYMKRIGKNEQRLKEAEKILDDIRRANDVRNLSDDDIGKLHDKYE